MTLTPKQRATYLAQNGWPLNLRGEPKPIVMLDKGELIEVAKRYASVLATEMRSITTRQEVA